MRPLILPRYGALRAFPPDSRHRQRGAHDCRFQICFDALFRGRAIRASSWAMPTNHHRIRTRCCAYCAQPFVINPRLGKRHRFCSKRACALASRTCARKKWLRKNGGKSYFTGRQMRPKNMDRVLRWRTRNPRYWRKTRREKLVLNPQIVLPKRISSAMRYVSLQDTIDTRFALEIALFLIARAFRYKIR